MLTDLIKCGMLRVGQLHKLCKKTWGWLLQENNQRRGGLMHSDMEKRYCYHPEVDYYSYLYTAMLF